MAISISPTQRTHAGAILAASIGSVAAFKGLESMTPPALPMLQEEFGASRASISWVLTGILLTGPIVTPIVARLGEVWDKRRTLLGVLLIVALGTLTSALSVSMPVLIAGQLLQGFGLSTVPLAIGIIRESQSAGRTKSANGLMVGAIFGSTALAMLTAGPIADHLSYRWLFWGPLIVVAGVIITVWAVVPPSPQTPKQRVRVDMVGGALLGSSLALVLLALTYAPGWGWLTPPFLLLLGSGLLTLGLFVYAELSVTEPLIDLRLMKNYTVITAAGLMFVAGFCINVVLVVVPMQVQQPAATGYGLGATATTTSVILVSATLIGLSAPLASWLDTNIGPRFASAIGPLSVIGSVFFMVTAGSRGSALMIVAAILLCAFGFSMAMTQSMNLVVSGVPPERVAAFNGLNYAIQAVAGTLGAQIAGSILSTDSADAADSPSWTAFCVVWGICGLLAGAAVLLALTNRAGRIR
ncbi:MFS transporter [Nocardia carnea]|uniref:MFS transporter n=1 Tax=Nocardia carnea TaxID=37328 RepID=UPI002455E599|nr:MFS transporter [Nocardia carnea]